MSGYNVVPIDQVDAFRMHHFHDALHFGQEAGNLGLPDRTGSVDTHNQTPTLLTYKRWQVDVAMQEPAVGPTPRGRILVSTGLLHELTQRILPVDLGVKQVVQLAPHVARALAVDALVLHLTLTYGLLDLALQFLDFFLGHVLGTFPIMLVEALVPFGWLVLAKQVEHLLAVHTPVLLVKQPDSLTVHGGQLKVLARRVHVLKHQVNPVVASHVRTLGVLLEQLLPDGRIGIGILETYSSQVAIDELKMAAAIKGWCDIYRPRLVCFDRYATQTIADRLAQSGVIVEDVSGQQFYKACGDLLEGMTNLRVVHNGQKELIEQFTNTAAKQNDSGWRIIKRKSAGDISAPIGLAMVVSKLMLPAPKPQIYT